MGRSLASSGLSIASQHRCVKHILAGPGGIGNLAAVADLTER